ncbi:MAG: hypothetical protein HYZ90_04075 [Candidatus Omnitrophica bacterium]|nr:hypothetical protein [Candidatus Omnitrophota bacterium]
MTLRLNLMPTSEQAARSVIPDLPWREIGMAAGALLFLYSSWTILAQRVQSRQLARLLAEMETLAPQRSEFEKVQTALRALQNRSNVMKGLKAAQAQWAPRLNLLSDALVSDLWFTHLRFGLAQTGEASGQPEAPEMSPAPPAGPLLLLQGSALVGGEGKPAAVSRFLQRLKEHPEFSRWFSGMELKGVEQRRVGQEEVSDFLLALTPSQG